MKTEKLKINYEELISKHKELTLLILFIVLDTACLYFYTEKMGLILPVAIILSILFASLLDFFSYAASFYGAGAWLNNPSFRRFE